MSAAAPERLVDGPPVSVANAAVRGSVVLVCEHASNFVPSRLRGQHASDEVLQSHAGWDLGALEVATRLSLKLNAPLVAATMSRLVYDLNRPPESPDAIRTISEVHDVPGNVGLSSAERAQRAAAFHNPFHETLADVLRIQQGRISEPVLVTIHTFAPIYFGKIRATQIGILHDVDRRFADAMLYAAPLLTNLRVARNEPYAASDGVTHTLRKHALPNGLLNVVIEIRNDLVETPEQQDAVASTLADMIHVATDLTRKQNSEPGRETSTC